MMEHHSSAFQMTTTSSSTSSRSPTQKQGTLELLAPSSMQPHHGISMGLLNQVFQTCHHTPYGSLQPIQSPSSNLTLGPICCPQLIFHHCKPQGARKGYGRAHGAPPAFSMSPPRAVSLALPTSCTPAV